MNQSMPTSDLFNIVDGSSVAQDAIQPPAIQQSDSKSSLKYIVGKYHFDIIGFLSDSNIID